VRLNMTLYCLAIVAIGVLTHGAHAAEVPSIKTFSFDTDSQKLTLVVNHGGKPTTYDVGSSPGNLIWDPQETQGTYHPQDGDEGAFTREWELALPDDAGDDDTYVIAVGIANANGLDGALVCLRVGTAGKRSSAPILTETQCPAVPTVSEWGLIILFLLLLTAGTIVIRRCMRHSQDANDMIQPPNA
jgi:hypothetical protein